MLLVPACINHHDHWATVWLLLAGLDVLLMVLIRLIDLRHLHQNRRRLRHLVEVPRLDHLDNAVHDRLTLFLWDRPVLTQGPPQHVQIALFVRGAGREIGLHLPQTPPGFRKFLVCSLPRHWGILSSRAVVPRHREVEAARHR